MNGGMRALAVFAAAFLVVAITATGSPATAAEADLLREEIGVDYEELATKIQAAYEEARRDALNAGDILLNEDGNGYGADAAQTALTLYEAAVARLRKTLSTFDQVHEKVPLLFVDLEYLIVKSLSGIAAILSLQGDVVAARETRRTLIELAEDNRERLAFALERNVLPQFHDRYREVDGNFRLALSESYVWMGHEAETEGHLSEARTNYETALALTEDPDGREAITELLQEVTAAEHAVIVPATSKPLLMDPVLTGDPALAEDPALGEGVPVLRPEPAAPDTAVAAPVADAADPPATETAGASASGPETAGASASGPEKAGASASGPEKAGASASGPEKAGASASGPEKAGASASDASKAGATTEQPPAEPSLAGEPEATVPMPAVSGPAAPGPDDSSPDPDPADPAGDQPEAATEPVASGSR